MKRQSSFPNLLINNYPALGFFQRDRSQPVSKVSFIIFEYDNTFSYMMLLIADSGSTKSSWSMVNSIDGSYETCQTTGINPMYQDEQNIYKLLQKEFTLKVPDSLIIYFYGAGCISEKVNETVGNALNRLFKSSAIHVDTDLMAAARSLCQDSEGIACILGTGSNSCYYDGKAISKNVSPLGFMLGDEGSGAVLGRKFISDLLKNQLPDPIGEKFFSYYKTSPNEIMEHVYRKPFPNRYLAQFTHFIHENIHEPALHHLVKNSFIEFFKRNIKQYPEASHLPVHFNGGTAYHFKTLIIEACKESGYICGDVVESPMEGLIKYHLHHN